MLCVYRSMLEELCIELFHAVYFSDVDTQELVDVIVVLSQESMT